MFFKRVKNLCEYVKRHEQSKRIIVFGGSDTIINSIKDALPLEAISYFIDNDKSKWKDDGKYKVCSPERLLQEADDNYLVLILSCISYWTMRNQLVEMEISNYIAPLNEIIYTDTIDEVNEKFKLNESEIKSVYEYLADARSKEVYSKILQKRGNYLIDFSDICEPNQYFYKQIFKPCTDDIYVDIGVFDGDTIKEFLLFSNGEYKKIYGFEPNSLHYNNTVAIFKNKENIVINQYAIYDKDILLNFGEDSIIDRGDSLVEAKRLDGLIKDKVTFIKMDIEGAETKALLGAEQLIKKYAPKLAISIYHKTEDLWELPLLIKKMVPEYSFYIRHHRHWYGETVLYAKI